VVTPPRTISEFVEAERSRFSDPRENRFVLAFGEVIRYQRFLSLILDRYREASREVSDNLQALQAEAAAHAPGERQATSRELGLWEKNRVAGERLHLEIESFFLFGKMMLDRSASAVECYFGQGRGTSLASFDKLGRNFARYCEQKGLGPPSSGMTELMVGLQAQLSDARDKEIAHVHLTSRIVGTTVSATGRNVACADSPSLRYRPKRPLVALAACTPPRRIPSGADRLPLGEPGTRPDRIGTALARPQWQATRERRPASPPEKWTPVHPRGGASRR
jgi:hypothetical protein